MAYTEKNSKQVNTQQDPSQKDARSGNERPDFGIPNSVMAQMISGADDGNNKPGSTVNRQMFPYYHQIPSAEAEADRLSVGIHGSNPDEVRREMGDRLGADFSLVQFHSDINSVRRASQMGARAWTSGRDVYFGRGGFEPHIAAHELVHTVQQGAVRGNVSQHASAGSVQMWPWSKKHTDIDTRSYDIVNSLVKLEAGNTKNRGKRAAQANAAYAQAYNRARENEENTDEDAKKAGVTAAKNTDLDMADTRLSEREQVEFRTNIQNMTYEDYDEVMSRWEDEAVALYDYRQSLGESYQPGMLDFKAANSPEGRNYHIFKAIIRRMERNIPPEQMKSWRNQRARTVHTDPERAQKIAEAAEIYDNGTKATKNSYLTTEEGIESMNQAGKEADEYYKKVYKGKAGPRKKDAIDKLALQYRAGLENQKNSGKNKKDKSKIDLLSDDNLIKNDESEDNLIKIDKSVKDDESEDNIIRTSSSVGGMKENSDLFNISPNKKNLIDIDDEKDLLNKESKPTKPKDENDIIRSSRMVDEDFIASFAPGNADVANVKEADKHFGMYKSASNIAAQSSLLAHNSTVGNSFKTGVSGMGLVSGALGMASGIHDMKRNAQNVAAGGEKMEVVKSALDTAASASSFAAGGFGTINNLASFSALTEPLSSVTNLGGENLVPGLNIATGAATAISGAMQWRRSQKGLNEINQQIAGLKSRGKLSDDQQKLMNAFKQGKYKSEMNRTSGALKAASGALTTGSGIAGIAAGPILGPIIALGLGIGSLITGVGRYAYEKVKKKKIRAKATADELNINWETEMRNVRNMFPGRDLSDKEVRAIILKGHGYGEGTRTAAMKTITMRRAKLLIDTAEGNSTEATMAQRVIAALGVHPMSGGPRIRYASGAVKLLAEKLG